MFGAVAGVITWLFSKNLAATTLIVSLTVGFAVAAFTWLYYRREFVRGIRRMVVDSRGDDEEAVHVIVQSDPSGILMSWLGLKFYAAWSSVTVIDQTPEHVNISGLGNFGMSIPVKAFACESARSAFVEQARAWRAAAGGTWNRVGHRSCPKCGYDLFACESNVCPECGESIPIHNAAADSG